MTEAIQQFRIAEDVEFVLQQAEKKSSKKNRNELTLVDILETYEKLVDANSKQHKHYLQPENRAKVYLALLKFKKDKEFE